MIVIGALEIYTWWWWWWRGRPRPRWHCVRWGSSSP